MVETAWQPDAAAGASPAARLRRRTAFAALPPRDLSRESRSYFYCVLLTAVIAAAASLGGEGVVGRDWSLFGLLTVCGAATQLFAIHTPRNRVFHAGVLFVIAAAVVLPPALVVAMCVLQHLPDWVRKRYRWYIQTFNIGNYIVAASAASLTTALVRGVAGADEIALTCAGVVASAAFLLTNRILLAAMLELARGLSPRETGLFSVSDLALEWSLALIGVTFSVGLIHEPWLSPLALAPLLLIYYLQRQTRELAEAADTIGRQNDSLAEMNELLRERTVAAMEGLAATVDARDAYTAGHSRRVQRLSLLVGTELGMAPAELDLLATAALFHDIGKIAIPDAILLKPGRLDDREWRVMRTHSEEGAKIIARLGFLDDAVPAIRHHHERFDGSGYPDGLSHEEIPLPARIIHLADALDSMLSQRVYNNPRPLDAVLAEIRTSAGAQFCPDCVAALDRVISASGTDVLRPEDSYRYPHLKVA